MKSTVQSMTHLQSEPETGPCPFKGLMFKCIVHIKLFCKENDYCCPGINHGIFECRREAFLVWVVWQFDLEGKSKISVARRGLGTQQHFRVEGIPWVLAERYDSGSFKNVTSSIQFSFCISSPLGLEESSVVQALAYMSCSISTAVSCGSRLHMWSPIC